MPLNYSINNRGIYPHSAVLKIVIGVWPDKVFNSLKLYETAIQEAVSKAVEKAKAAYDKRVKESEIAVIPYNPLFTFEFDTWIVSPSLK